MGQVSHTNGWAFFPVKSGRHPVLQNRGKYQRGRRGYGGGERGGGCQEYARGNKFLLDANIALFTLQCNINFQKEVANLFARDKHMQ